MSFSPASWFEQLFGFKESPRQVQAHLTCSREGENVLITSDVNHQTYNAGNFQLRTPSSFKNLPVRGGGTLNILVGHGYRTKQYNLIDALSSQSIPENDGASYVAASNFNCLEFVGARQTASDGVTNYVYDFTQGPYLALGCPQSAVYRNYFYEHPDGTIGQINKEIELLGKTPITVQHGHALISKEDAKKLVESKFDFHNPDNFYVGVHKNCQVLLTQQGNSFARSQDNLLATHIYMAALNYANHTQPCEESMMIGKCILESEYKSAILAAWENSFEMEKQGRKGARKLYLTLVGGGVFDNPISMICEAIVSSEKEIIDSGLEVTIVFYKDSLSSKVESFLSPFVTKTGGKVTRLD